MRRLRRRSIWSARNRTQGVRPRHGPGTERLQCAAFYICSAHRRPRGRRPCRLASGATNASSVEASPGVSTGCSRRSSLPSSGGSWPARGLSRSGGAELRSRRSPSASLKGSSRWPRWRFISIVLGIPTTPRAGLRSSSAWASACPRIVWRSGSVALGSPCPRMANPRVCSATLRDGYDRDSGLQPAASIPCGTSRSGLT